MNNGILRCLKIRGLKESELVSALEVFGAQRLQVSRYVVVISINNSIDALLTWMTVIQNHYRRLGPPYFAASHVLEHSQR